LRQGELIAGWGVNTIYVGTKDKEEEKPFLVYHPDSRQSNSPLASLKAFQGRIGLPSSLAFSPSLAPAKDICFIRENCYFTIQPSIVTLGQQLGFRPNPSPGYLSPPSIAFVTPLSAGGFSPSREIRRTKRNLSFKIRDVCLVFCL
jgi:hypothetical protein